MYFYNTDTGVSQWHPPDPKLVRPPTQAFVSDFAFPAPGEEGAHQYMCMPGDDLTPRQWNIEYTTAWLQWNFVTYHAVWAKFLSPLHPVRHSLGFENSLQAQRYAPLPYIRGPCEAWLAHEKYHERQAELAFQAYVSSSQSGINHKPELEGPGFELGFLVIHAAKCSNKPTQSSPQKTDPRSPEYFAQRIAQAMNAHRVALERKAARKVSARCPEPASQASGDQCLQDGSGPGPDMKTNPDSRPVTWIPCKPGQQIDIGHDPACAIQVGRSENKDQCCRLQIGKLRMLPNRAEESSAENASFVRIPGSKWWVQLLLTASEKNIHLQLSEFPEKAPLHVEKEQMAQLPVVGELSFGCDSTVRFYLRCKALARGRKAVVSRDFEINPKLVEHLERRVRDSDPDGRRAAMLRNQRRLRRELIGGASLQKLGSASRDRAGERRKEFRGFREPHEAPGAARPLWQASTVRGHCACLFPHGHGGR
eukprot:INCI3609.4.p1 GENE.INCI3609.4~~INCI3609.4.p1  ORF type:complete len:479 (-),score=55.43 INCI3609.4:47-1483(-)